MKWICLFLILFGHTVYALQQDAHPFTSAQDAVRFQSLTKEIRCVVCQNQSIADSNAPLANDLREKIYSMVLEKQSDEEIKTFLTHRYGEFILLQPRVNQFTLVLWLFPFLSLIFIAMILYGFFTKHAKSGIAA